MKTVGQQLNLKRMQKAIHKLITKHRPATNEWQIQANKELAEEIAELMKSGKWWE
jgi:hypothetical protein